MPAIFLNVRFYHIKNLQSTKTADMVGNLIALFYHIKNLQSTKTSSNTSDNGILFYHIKNLQSTKTRGGLRKWATSFITLRIYKVLKQKADIESVVHVLSH